MLGAGGEQLAVYNGVQVAFDNELQGDNRYVYMYLHSYISAGGQLVTLADGTKQFNIVDNLGSVRCIVSWDGTAVSTQAYDYKPFGDLQNAGEENRIGYFGEQRDKESDYFAMGFRLYDPEIGRFLAIDALLDIQPSQTPYHYCFNNPTSFTDPTGLYPKKEKGDKVQDMEDALVYYAEQQAWYSFIEALRMEHFYNWMMQEQFPIGVYTWWGFGKARDGSTVAGSYSYNSRTGETTFDSRGLKFSVTNEDRKTVEKNIKLNIYPNVKNKSEAKTNFWKSFWEGHQEVSDEQLYFLTHAKIHVDIRQEDNYFFYSLCNSIDYELATNERIEDPAAVLGWTTYCSWGTIMTFSEAIFSDNCKDFGWYDFYDRNSVIHSYTRSLSMIILHEFGHSFAYYSIGAEYCTWYYKYQENWATWYMNQNYNIPRGIFPEKYDLNWLWLTGGFHRGYNPP